MGKNKTYPLHVDGEVEEERPNDERFQAILYAELVDFFMLYDLINGRLRWLCHMYDFKNFNALSDYYRDYVEPKLKEEYENSKNVSDGGK